MRVPVLVLCCLLTLSADVAGAPSQPPAPVKTTKAIPAPVKTTKATPAPVKTTTTAAPITTTTTAALVTTTVVSAITDLPATASTAPPATNDPTNPDGVTDLVTHPTEPPFDPGHCNCGDTSAADAAKSFEEAWQDVWFRYKKQFKPVIIGIFVGFTVFYWVCVAIIGTISAVICFPRGLAEAKAAAKQAKKR